MALIGYNFWCPGCEDAHPFVTDPNSDTVWSFNGDMESPTFSPSLGVLSDEYLRDWQNQPRTYKCHLFVRDGQITIPVGLVAWAGRANRSHGPLPTSLKRSQFEQI